MGDTHIPASETGLILNLDPLSASLVHDGYRADVGAAVRIARRAIGKELRLPPRLLMSAFVVDATAVRTLLAIHDATGDHTPDPRRIAIGVVGGTAAESLDTIARIEHQG
jgi:hypothetical protein